jgi:RNA polymerase sigma-70 factor, ECF subfamily
MSKRDSPDDRAITDEADPLDDQLMHEVRVGSTSAFEVVVGRYWSRTASYAQQLVGDPDAAADVAQEVFARLWSRRRDWTPGGSVRVWLLRATRNLVISEARKRNVRSRWLQTEAHDHVQRPRTPLQETERSELRVAIRLAVNELSPRRREAFALFHLQNLSYREIGEIMNVRPQTVANYLQAAIADLRQSLGAHFPGLADNDPSRSGS